MKAEKGDDSTQMLLKTRNELKLLQLRLSKLFSKGIDHYCNLQVTEWDHEKDSRYSGFKSAEVSSSWNELEVLEGNPVPCVLRNSDHKGPVKVSITNAP